MREFAPQVILEDFAIVLDDAAAASGGGTGVQPQERAVDVHHHFGGVSGVGPAHARLEGGEQFGEAVAEPVAGGNGLGREWRVEEGKEGGVGVDEEDHPIRETADEATG